VLIWFVGPGILWTNHPHVALPPGTGTSLAPGSAPTLSHEIAEIARPSRAIGAKLRDPLGAQVRRAPYANRGARYDAQRRPQIMMRFDHLAAALSLVAAIVPMSGCRHSADTNPLPGSSSRSPERSGTSSSAEVARHANSDLPTPSGMTATTNRCDVVDVTWNAVKGATGYDVLRSTTSGPTNATTLCANVSHTICRNTGATAYTTYYYWSRSRDAQGSVSLLSDRVAGTISP
jgi:hypothetical protein